MQGPWLKRVSGLPGSFRHSSASVLCASHRWPLAMRRWCCLHRCHTCSPILLVGKRRQRGEGADGGCTARAGGRAVLDPGGCQFMAAAFCFPGHFSVFVGPAVPERAGTQPASCSPGPRQVALWLPCCPFFTHGLGVEVLPPSPALVQAPCSQCASSPLPPAFGFGPCSALSESL